MNTPEQQKALVREKYGDIARQDVAVNKASCCGATAASGEVYNIMADEYHHLEGYAPDADLGLGCGLPTAYARIAEGDTVIDLGSGAGNDCFVARHHCGATGKVIGIDFTEAMIEKARSNADRLGYNNVEFRHGDIEHMPVGDATANVVLSNCVLNLVPNKEAVIREIYRVLKPGGHFSISDVVLEGELPDALRNDAEMYAGCIGGAIQKDIYMQYIHDAGFTAVSLLKEKRIALPADILHRYLSPEGAEQFLKGETGIYSITVYAEKPGKKSGKPTIKLSELASKGCTPGGGCC
jgi:ubiquinone/menaquinone biosynthesis C-methylase UbiE